MNDKNRMFAEADNENKQNQKHILRFHLVKHILSLFIF